MVSPGDAIWDIGVGAPAGGGNPRQEGPHPEETTLSSSTLGRGDWAQQLSGDR